MIHTRARCTTIAGWPQDRSWLRKSPITRTIHRTLFPASRRTQPNMNQRPRPRAMTARIPAWLAAKKCDRSRIEASIRSAAVLTIAHWPGSAGPEHRRSNGSGKTAPKYRCPILTTRRSITANGNPTTGRAPNRAHRPRRRPHHARSRGQGKLIFLTLRDWTGDIQILHRQETGRRRGLRAGQAV